MIGPPALAHFEPLRATTHGWLALCPAHADRSPSLTLALGDDGRLLLHCFAGCDVRAIVTAVGLPMSSLFAESAPRRFWRPLSDQEHAFRAALHEGRRQQMIRDTHREVFVDAELIRVGRQVADGLRAIVTRRGIDDDMAWDLLADAAAADREADRLDV
jgi:hypothetical protein